MSLTKESPAFHDHMEQQMREDANSYETYQDHRFHESREEHELQFDLMAPKRIAADVLQRGTMDALTAFVFLRQMAEEVDGALSSIKDAAIAEAKKYGSEGHEVNGVKVQAKAGSGRWDFTGCPEWETEKDRLRQVEERLKLAYQAASKGMMTASNDGEVIALPKYNAGSETIYCKTIR